ncbi:MAG: hypothetical protein QM662_11490 [Gordonia sp. (in: high G+C Gram-positive bacteria)]
MSTAFDGNRGGAAGELSLSEFPEWGLAIMRGLYGSETIDAACARDAERRHWARADDAEPIPLSPLQAELEAMDALADYLVRLVRRRLHRRR